MKKIFVLFGIAFLISITLSGCLDSGFNFDNSDNSDKAAVTEFKTGAPDNVPKGDHLIPYDWSINHSIATYSPEMLYSESDFVAYATVREVSPSVWSTSDGKAPIGLYDRMIAYDQDGNLHKLDYLSGKEYIYTLVTFELYDVLSGFAPRTFQLKIHGGQVDNVVMAETIDIANAWDLQVGNSYKLAVKEYDDTDIYFILHPGLWNAEIDRTDPNDIDPDKYGLNPLRKKTETFRYDSNKIPSFPYDSTPGAEFVHMTGDPFGETKKEAADRIKQESDVAFYGTVQEILPPVYSDNTATTGYPDEMVITPVVFSIGHLIKGNVSENVTVQVLGGFTDNYCIIVEGGPYSPTAWDFKVGDKYLLYLSDPSKEITYGPDEYYHIVYRGIFVVKE